MNQILICVAERSLGPTISIELEKKYNQSSLIKKDAVEAISMLELLPDFSLIICSEKFAPKIFEYLIKNHDENKEAIAVLVLGNTKSFYPKMSSLSPTAPFGAIVAQAGYLLGKEPAPVRLEDFLPKIKKIEPVVLEKEEEKKEEEEKRNEEEDDSDKTTVFRMPVLTPAASKIEEVEVGIEEKIEVKEERKKEIIEYSRINIKYLANVDNVKLDFNIYNKIKKKDGFEYNIKLADKTLVTRSEIDRIILRGGKEFFVNSKDFSHAKEFLFSHFLQKFKTLSYDDSERYVLNSDGFEILLDVFKNSAMDKYAVEIIKELINSLKHLTHSEDAFEEFFYSLKHKKLSYGYAHCHFTCLLIMKIVDKFTWSKEQSKNKIIYLSLFHDMALHSDRLIRIHHQRGHELEKITEDEKKTIANHANAAAIVLETIVKAPKELTSIIREHHGIKSGVGFLDSIGPGVSPLTMAFILVEDFVYRYLEVWDKAVVNEIQEVSVYLVEEIFAQLKLKYQKLTYADVLVELQLLFKNRI